METNPTTEKKSSGIYSFKPRGEQLIFLEGLLKEKGSMTEALKHVVDLAMNSGNTPVDDKVNELREQLKHTQKLLFVANANNEKLSTEYRELVSDLRAEILELQKKVDPGTKPATKSQSGIGMF